MATPKLRFKEFHEDWPKTSFQNLFIFKNSINASKEQYGSGTKFINVLDIINNPNGITYDSIIGSVQVSQKDIDKNLVNYGDVVFQRSSETREEVGQSNVYLSKEPVVFGGFVIRGSAQVPYDPLFMNGLLKTDKVRDQITQLSGGSTRFNIGQDSLNKVSIFLPSKEEQTKIATFLSVVDEKISQLSQKLHLLSQYKQGMMQKLFSQQIRFKADDGSEFGEWGEYKIFDLAIDKTLNNGVFNDQNKVGKGYKLINVLDMYIQRDIDESRLSLLDIDKKEFERNKVNYGDIFFTRSSLVKEGIAFSNVYLGVSNDITYDGHLIKLSPDLNIIEPKFLNYCLKVAYVRKQLIQGGKTATMTTIGQQEVGNTLVKIPCLEEQIRIANFLSAIDQKIDVVSKQIEQAKQWKKGLLQQMFI